MILNTDDFARTVRPFNFGGAVTRLDDYPEFVSRRHYCLRFCELLHVLASYCSDPANSHHVEVSHRKLQLPIGDITSRQLICEYTLCSEENDSNTAVEQIGDITIPRFSKDEFDRFQEMMCPEESMDNLDNYNVLVNFTSGYDVIPLRFGHYQTETPNQIQIYLIWVNYPSVKPWITKYQLSQEEVLSFICYWHHGASPHSSGWFEERAQYAKNKLYQACMREAHDKLATSSVTEQVGQMMNAEHQKQQTFAINQLNRVINSLRTNKR